MDTIGLIGVGLLGSAIAARLTAAGYGVLGYDLLPERRLGANSAQEVAGKCRTIMLCLPTSDVVAEVLGSDQTHGRYRHHRLHHRRARRRWLRWARSWRSPHRLSGRHGARLQPRGPQRRRGGDGRRAASGVRRRASAIQDFRVARVLSGKLRRGRADEAGGQSRARLASRRAGGDAGLCPRVRGLAHRTRSRCSRRALPIRG